MKMIIRVLIHVPQKLQSLIQERGPVKSVILNACFVKIQLIHVLPALIIYFYTIKNASQTAISMAPK